MELIYNNWRQTDPLFNREEAWPAEQFPDADYRYFRDAGCLVCALAVMLVHNGIEKAEDESRFDPWILNQRLIGCGAFTPAADLNLSDIGRLYPLNYLGALPYSQESLTQAAESGLPCLVSVPGVHAEHHFTTLLRMLPDEVIVYDPLCGERKLSSYGRICEIRLFCPLSYHHDVFFRNPETGRLDEDAIRKILTQPVTVLEGDIQEQERVLARPDRTCTSYTGVVTCASQGVHILVRGKEWTLIEAYSSADEHSDVKVYAKHFEGWVQTDRLRELEVDHTYGLVIDKLLQQMYVFRDGELFTTLMVSTGILTEDASSLETPAGEFLIVSWEGAFWAGSNRCNAGMRINRSIFIHEVPGTLKTDSSGNRYLDYAVNERRLGEKASHGCIRVQRTRSPEGVNAKWLFDNLHRRPFTKVIILDDRY